MKEVPYELFKKYFNGETDASENRKLIEWLLEDKENEKVFADTLSVISAAAVSYTQLTLPTTERV